MAVAVGGAILGLLLAGWGLGALTAGADEEPARLGAHLGAPADGDVSATLLSGYDRSGAAVAPGESYQTLPFVRPGGEILLKIEGWPKVEDVLRHIDAIERVGIDACDVAPDHWRHVAQQMQVGEAPRSYTPERHQAWLKRREIER